MGRALRKTSEFLSAVEKERESYTRLPEAVAGAEFVLLRSPELGMAVRGTRFSSWPVHLSDGVTFKIVYTFDAYEVVFQALYPAVAPGQARRRPD